MRGLLAALQHIHQCGVVHRDVKSENLLLTDAMTVVLSDFGIAVRPDDEEAMKVRGGSIGYAAPEVLAGRQYGYAVDLFGAGVVKYVLDAQWAASIRRPR